LNLRSGRLKGKMTSDAVAFTSSLEFDKRIFEADIQCNLAHTTMLKEQGIILPEDADKIINALHQLESEGIGALHLDPSAEDIHMAVENYVTHKIGDIAGFMHTGKSRNDQVATDLRMVLKKEIETIQKDILKFIHIILDKAQKHKDTIMVGYTHLQHAQPTTFAHYLLSHAHALKRDYERLKDAYQRVDMCPLGSAALTTTSFNLNRERTRELLGFSKILENSIDAVSSRDFMAETVFSLAMLASTLSKICEEMIIWSTYEFGMLEISHEFSSTSSIMPQKKNPDVAEIVRAKTAALYGELVTILTILKALPQSYNRDLQEVTPHLWHAVDTGHSMLNITADMLSTMEFNQERGAELAQSNFSTATELADLMVKEKKIPFRVAHQIVGRAVTEALQKGIKPGEIDSEFLDKISGDITGETLQLNDELVIKALDPYEVIKSRKIIGGPSPEVVEEDISKLKDFVESELT
jgi:argininosuccinate lyase